MYGDWNTGGPTRYCHIMNERMDEIGLTLPKRIMMQSIWQERQLVLYSSCLPYLSYHSCLSIEKKHPTFDITISFHKGEGGAISPASPANLTSNILSASRRLGSQVVPAVWKVKVMWGGWLPI